MNREDVRSSPAASLVAIAAVTCAIAVLYLPLLIG
jgi:hypothetical protein